MHNRRRRFRGPMIQLLLFLAAFTLVIDSSADDEPSPNTENVVADFLSSGQAYITKFPPSYGLFTTHRVLAGTVTTRNSFADVETTTPSFTTATISCQCFRLTQIWPRGWVQVEHPVDPSEYLKWGQKLIAERAILKAEFSKNTREHFEELAAVVVKTKRTWVNIDHALTVEDLPLQITKPEVHVRMPTSATVPD